MLTVGTDTYLLVADIDAYFAGRAFGTNWVGDVSDKEKAARTAVKHLDAAYRWKGQIAIEGQKLKWPRINVIDDEGYAVDSSIVPDAVKDAQCELALQWLIADQLTPDPKYLTAGTMNTPEAGAVKREKLGPMEREYFEKDTYQFATGTGYLMIKKAYPYIEMLLKPYILGTSDDLFKDIIQ